MSFIVVGVDGSETSRTALAAAVDQGSALGVPVRAVNVVVLPLMSGYEYGPIDLGDMRTAAQRNLDEAIAGVTERRGGTLPVSVSTHVVTGHVGIELLRMAESDGGAAMVVAGSRGLGGFSSLLLGSVTTYLAHHLTCPLLIIPALKDAPKRAAGEAATV